MKGRDQGLGIRGPGFEPLLVLGFLVAFGMPCFAQDILGMSPEPRLQITVRVYDYAQVSPRTLGHAEEEASRTLRAAGVEMAWVDCPTSVEVAANYPACEPPLGAMAVDLRILPPSMVARLQSGHEQLGFALPSTKAGSASAAWIFHHRVEQLADSKDADQAQILGHAMGHEIGHVLLGPNRHSNRGIMRANWDRNVLQEAARGQLLFSREQAAVMRAEVRVRAQ